MKRGMFNSWEFLVELLILTRFVNLVLKFGTASHSFKGQDGTRVIKLDGYR